MAEQNRPASDDMAPDPATVYERAKPEKEAGMGRLDNNEGTPTNRPDCMEKAVRNKQIPEHQVNAEDVINGRARRPLGKQG
jgi:hypothetical protein